MGQVRPRDRRSHRKTVAMIDRSLNYGRHHIEQFLRLAGKFGNVLDVGAGYGADLALCRNVNPHAILYAVEAYPEYSRRLADIGINVHQLNIENEPLRLPTRPSTSSWRIRS